MDQGPLRITVEDGVATFLFARPPVNAFNLALYKQVSEELADLAARDDVRCLVFGSAIDKIFCGGADVNDFKAAAANPDSGEVREATVMAMQHAIREFPYPTVAVVDGAAVGAGAVFATLCDIRLASTRAWFSIPEVNVARVGGPHHMRRLLPEGVMRHLYFGALRLTAERAYQLGFVQELTSPEEIWEAARTLSTNIAGKSAVGLRLGKKAINDAEYLSIWDGHVMEQQYSYRLGRIDTGLLLGDSAKRD